MASGASGGSSRVAKSPSPAIDRYEAESAASTLTRAEEIRGNPSLHRAANRHMRKQIQSLRRASAAKPMPMKMSKKGR